MLLEPNKREKWMILFLEYIKTATFNGELTFWALFRTQNLQNDALKKLIS